MKYLVYIFIVFLFLCMTYYKKKNKTHSYEHFIGLYENMNALFENKKNISSSNTNNNRTTKTFRNFHSLFLKNIYITQNKTNTKMSFYFLNYEHTLYLKINAFYPFTKNRIEILDDKNDKIGHLKSQKYNTYVFDLQKIYKKDYIFEVRDSYHIIKITGYFLENVYYLKKNNDTTKNKEYICYLFEKEIGHVLKSENSYKINIENKYIDQINLFGIALMIIQLNTSS